MQVQKNYKYKNEVGLTTVCDSLQKVLVERQMFSCFSAHIHKVKPENKKCGIFILGYLFKHFQICASRHFLTDLFYLPVLKRNQQLYKYHVANSASDCLAPSHNVQWKVDAVKKVNYSAINLGMSQYIFCAHRESRTAACQTASSVVFIHGQ